MDKDEMKNRISMALKDPILQQGFEIICKNLEELEKENLYYKDVVETNTAEWEEQGQRVVALEKENAELKDEWQEQVQKANDEGYARTLQTMQLTKAKEIINKLIELVDFLNEDNVKEPVVAEAEQFINDFKQEE